MNAFYNDAIRFIYVTIKVKWTVSTDLLRNARYNKGTAFTKDERSKFGLTSRLPPVVETLEQQLQRSYDQYKRLGDSLQKHVYLSDVFDTNQTLFYALVTRHLPEMYPIIYTPTESQAIKQYSKIYRYPNGCYLDIEHNDPEYMKEQFAEFGKPGDIQYIVITDSEGILGIGDQGIGGILISVAKGHLMTLCSGLDPNRFLPIVLDVGTNNKDHREDPKYLGLRKDRVHGEEYGRFLENVIHSVKETFPNAFIHFEDFGRSDAKPVLDRYSPKLPCFNDDIQGTGVVTLAAIFSAIRLTKSKLNEQKFVIVGAGTAGVGIADRIVSSMVKEGITREEARDKIYLLDKQGLILDKHADRATEGQKPYLKKGSVFADQSSSDEVDLETTVSTVHPTALIGVSGQAGIFSENIVREMSKHTKQPIIFPLSNPTDLMEAKPSDLNEWTDGKGLIASGSPVPPVKRNGKDYYISQCNNAFIYPSVGVAAVLSECKTLTEEMLSSAADGLASTPRSLFKSDDSLLPDLTNVREVSRHVKFAILKQALAENNCADYVPREDEALKKWIKQTEWNAEYAEYE
ncbi:malic enzyme [Schizosaccharomyces cryophilus OY26]|uniref:Malic enzyme n=1 Tax=Schizosaccharomyces cryophilus (strain OY26 / ATCC MYA-4695 / CBS 11777 / NBRC 106824 / NRRL Y48691) TaxID=653667 RepID=S9VT49_SCHCR|nr:malic enzyme [Schizosaccharomyces cryophilus OY26]EPY51043.1 malic enzyme [Schizosaccharomyces cryophilus OY26]